MCLAIPGLICEIRGQGLTREGRVRFGQIEKEVNLAFTPGAKEGDYVIVHVGCAISILDEAEAERVFSSLTEAGLMHHEVS